MKHIKANLTHSMYFAILILVQAVFVPTSLAEEAFSIGKTYTIESSILKEQRAFHVYLPASYNTNSLAEKHYPVMYVLDGAPYFHRATAIVDLYADYNYAVEPQRQIPEMIIVGVENTIRNRDFLPTHSLKDYFGDEDEDYKLSGDADNFLSFLEKELLPNIDERYRTLSTNILVGESFGGLLALHALVNRPTIFQSYIATDPSLWWDENETAKGALEALNEECSLTGSLYISTTPIPDGLPIEPMEDGRKIFNQAIKPCENTLRYLNEHFSEEGHSSVTIPSLINGLKFIFADYSIDFARYVDSPETITKHFEKVSKSVGGPIPPQEQTMINFGYYLLFSAQDIEKAIAHFQQVVKLFPNSRNSLRNLAFGYEQSGNKAMALKTYEANLVIFPDDEETIEAVKKLKRK